MTAEECNGNFFWMLLHQVRASWPRGEQSQSGVHLTITILCFGARGMRDTAVTVVFMSPR